MDRLKRMFTIGFLVLMIMPPAAALGKGYGNRHGGGGNQTGINTADVANYYAPPDQTEVDDLVFMREEEKVARDVYLEFYSLWKDPVFLAISKSEERHMLSLKNLIDKYGITDPVTGDNVGKFSDPDLQGLYKQMVQEGTAFLLDALRVGATIEDLDISDLQAALANTDNQDIRTVYQNLMKGSRNHLRIFINRLSLLGITYQPQYLDQEAFDAIIESAMEKGRVDADGNPANFGKRRKRGIR
jgi:hypothetical protein